jgi:hypothetical protein
MGGPKLILENIFLLFFLYFSVFCVKRLDDFSSCPDGVVVRRNVSSPSPNGSVSAIAYVALRPDGEPLRVKSLSPAPHNSFFTLFLFCYFFFCRLVCFLFGFSLFLTRALVLLLFFLHPRYDFFPFY